MQPMAVWENHGQQPGRFRSVAPIPAMRSGSGEVCSPTGVSMGLAVRFASGLPGDGSLLGSVHHHRSSQPFTLESDSCR